MPPLVTLVIMAAAIESLTLPANARAVAIESLALPENERAGLEPAIAAVVVRFNTAEKQRRETAQVETVGPEDAPYLLRVSYRQATTEHAIVALDQGPPSVVTVRIRAVEIEKRAANVSVDGIDAALAKAPWKPAPRGWLLDFHLRWTGATWEQLGEPLAHATLGAHVGAQLPQSQGSATSVGR